MEIFITNIILIKKPTQQLLKWCRQSLIFKNPEYQKKAQMGFYVGRTPKLIRLYSYDSNDDVLELPSGCISQLQQFITPSDKIIDYRSEPKANIKSKIVLRDYQKPALKIFDYCTNGLVVMFCGGGKSETALALAAELNLKTLFVTHTEDLVKQAYDRCKDKLTCSQSYIKNGKVDYSGDVVFGLVQTLVKNLDKIPQDTFGLVIVDECHRTSTSAQSIGMFRECIEYFAAKYKMGMSATLSRSDGLEVCIPYIIGQPLYEVKDCVETNEYIGYLKGDECIKFSKSKFQIPAKVTFIQTHYTINNNDGSFKDVFDRSGMTLSFSKLVNDLSMNTMRNKLIIDCVNNTDGSVIVLSDRVEQLRYLQKHIPNSVEIDGGTKKEIREQHLNDVSSGKVRVLLASYKIGKEGLNIPRLANVVLATPIKDESTLVQSIGRAQRPFGDKTLAKVFDFVDDVSTLNRFYTKRRSVYKRKAWL